MSEEFTARTSIELPDAERVDISGLKKSFAYVALLVRLFGASTCGARHAFVEESVATQVISNALVESSTQLHEMTPEARAEFQAILDGARHDIIEDGMPNTVSERLPELIKKHLDAVIPALVSAIEMGRTPPIIAAEVLKTLGRLRNPASHATRRWVLERALNLSSPFIRDGAGLGLARLADPGAIPYLIRAIEAEPNPQIRADLQAVIDELAETK